MLKRSLPGIFALAALTLLAACSTSKNKATPAPASPPVPSIPPATRPVTRSLDATLASTESLVRSGSLTPTPYISTASVDSATEAVVALTPTASMPPPPRVLTVCLGNEPPTLFLYQAFSSSARSVLQAIYDGPLDVQNFDDAAVILENKPSLANGGATLEAVEVQPGESFVDDRGNLTTLVEGAVYRPSGCNETACSQAYAGNGTVSMDQMVVKFRLLPSLAWSDGAPLTADDSVYSFEVASRLYPLAQAEQVIRTASYRALDAQGVEWRGLPGLADARYTAYFFSPLPRHAWESLSTTDLLQSDATTKAPLGWGPYVIEQWIAGDHITLRKNLGYFRASEGLPYFDNLVFRFVDDNQQMIDALATGECDMADSSAMQGVELNRLLEYQQTGQLQVYFQPAAWEMAMFGIMPFAEGRPDLFGKAETRRAITQCIDREKMAQVLWNGQSMALDAYALPANPLFNPQARHWAYDPAQASAQLETIGWLDADGDPATPRLAQGISGVPDGTPLEFTYLVSSDAERPQAAQMLADSLAQCGVRVHVKAQPAADFLSAGKDSPVFGRAFDLAQLAFPFTLQPSCEWFTSAEIPGPYPEHSQGWGGANAAGYQNPEFDQACQAARTSLTESPLQRQAYFRAQAIFADDLPVIPLYVRLNVLAARPGLCGVRIDASTTSALWNLETWGEGEDCGQR